MNKKTIRARNKNCFILLVDIKSEGIFNFIFKIKKNIRNDETLFILLSFLINSIFAV